MRTNILSNTKLKLFLRYASEVSVGDEVLVHGNDELIPTRVINIADLKTEGNCL